MTQQTPLGLTYPEAGDHTRMWEHFQTLAEDADGLLTPETWTFYPTSFTGAVVLTRNLHIVVCSLQLTHPSPPWTSPSNYQINTGDLLPTQFRPALGQVQQAVAMNYNAASGLAEANGICTVTNDGRMLIGPDGVQVRVIRGLMMWATA